MQIEQLIILIVSLAVVAGCINCERATLQDVMDYQVKLMADATTESTPATDASASLPVVASSTGDQSNSRQDSKATQTADEPAAPKKCSCDSQEPQSAKTPEKQIESASQVSSTNLPPAGISVKATKQEKTKKYKVITITIPEDDEAVADALVEPKLAPEETKQTEAKAVAEDQESKSDEKVSEEAVVAKSSNADEALEEGEEEVPKAAKEVKDKKEKKISKKSKYDNNGNKREKRQTKGGSGSGKKSSGVKSKNGGKNKNNKRKSKK